MWLALVTLWLCILLLRPRPPVGENQDYWYFYSRERGRHTWGLVVTICITLFISGVVLLQHIPTPPNRDMQRLRGDAYVYGEFYWHLNDDGTWELRRT